VSRTTWTPDRETPKVFARLSGDFNPVHMDEEHARAAGFDTVIVHGMCVLGAAARAACLFAPHGSVLRELDVRFANPVLPGQRIDFDGQTKERGGNLKVGLDARLDGETRIMSPASFTFGAAEQDWEVPRRVVLDTSEQDVVGDVYRFAGAGIDDYLRITAPNELPEGEGIPPMAGLLGMTGALEKAFRGVEPEHPGTWVHLRQQGVFYRPIELDTDYVCRIQNGLTVVRNSKIGVHVTIPFLVETPVERGLVNSGACVLLYAYER
jgi:hypothetical protein